MRVKRGLSSFESARPLVTPTCDEVCGRHNEGRYPDYLSREGPVVNRKPEELLKSIHRTHELIISAEYDIVGFPDHGIHSATFAETFTTMCRVQRLLFLGPRRPR